MKTKFLLSIAIPALLFVACGSEAKESAPKEEGAISAALVEKLAKADAVDGTVDKVVHQCAGCALGMPGKADMSVTVAEYELHLCSDKCKTRFETDAKGELEKLKIPE